MATASITAEPPGRHVPAEGSVTSLCAGCRSARRPWQEPVEHRGWRGLVLPSAASSGTGGGRRAAGPGCSTGDLAGGCREQQQPLQIDPLDQTRSVPPSRAPGAPLARGTS